MNRSTRYKRCRLRALAEARQTHELPGYTNLRDYHDGYYECKHVSPYTKSANDVDSKVLLLLQDWRSREWLLRHRSAVIQEKGHDPALATNRKLKALLFHHLDLQLSSTYGTNLFPHIKPGSLSATIPEVALTRAALQYALPQIACVRPKIVICFGLQTYNAIRRALGRPAYRLLRNAVQSSARWGSTVVACQPHPGVYGELGLRRHTGYGAEHYWRRMVRRWGLTANPSIEGMPKRLRLLCTPHVKR